MLNKWLRRMTVLVIAFGPTATFSQEIIKQQPCTDTATIYQADSITALLKKGGFQLIREASMQMESQYEMPVVVPLDKKTVYQIVFIGDRGSRLFELRIQLADGGQVYYEKKLTGDPQANVISYRFQPPDANYYILKTLQIQNKKKKLCGKVLLFKKEAGSPE